MDETIRASDDERRATTDLLGRAAGEGRLTLEEHSERVDAALVATHRDQLDKLTCDLPASAPSEVLATMAPPPVPVRMLSVFGDIRRSGAWSVPATGAWRTVFGDLDLDLRQARLTSAMTELDLSTLFGDVEVLVPSGVLVEVRCRTVFGDVRQQSAEVAAPGAPRLILTGNCLFGDVRVLDAPRRRGWRRWLGQQDDVDPGTGDGGAK